MNNKIKEYIKDYILFFILIILIGITIKCFNVINIVKTIFKLLIPILIGFTYAWLLNPLINRLSENKKRSLISILVFISLIFIIGLFLYFLIPTIYKEISELYNLLPNLIDNINTKLNKLNINNIPIKIINIVKDLIRYIGIIAIGLILGLYMSIDYNEVTEFIHKLYPKKYKETLIPIIRDISNNVRNCINGMLLISFLVFIGSLIGFIIIKTDMPLLLGIVCGITDLIPYIGPYIGGIIAVLFGFTKSKLIGILTIVVCIIVQSIENYILQPIIMSKKINISPICIIIGLLVFGELFGIIGMIISTPLVAIIKVILENITEKKGN